MMETSMIVLTIGFIWKIIWTIFILCTEYAALLLILKRLAKSPPLWGLGWVVFRLNPRLSWPRFGIFGLAERTTWEAKLSVCPPLPTNKE